jgi:hypothetical protein
MPSPVTPERQTGAIIISLNIGISRKQNKVFLVKTDEAPCAVRDAD